MKVYVYSFLLFFTSCISIKTADIKNNTLEPKIVHYTSDDSMEYDFPFSDATIVNGIVYVAGQVGNLPGNNEVVPGGIKAETRQTMKNIQRILNAVGSSMDKVFKCTCMLADIDDWGAMSEEYKTFFDKEKRPSRSAFAGTGLALGAKIEIECWAVR